MMAAEEPTDQALAMAEEFIAHESIVELWKWQETSSAGFKVMLYLPNRDLLGNFDNVMKRRKGHAGHRYKCIFSSPETGNVTREMECQFWGRNWSESAGASLALHFHGDDMHWWKGLTTKDQGDPETDGRKFYLMMMELDEDDQVINQANARKFAAVHARERGKVDQDGSDVAVVKGGPKSIHVARILQEPEFLVWFNNHSIYKGAGPMGSFKEVDAYMKKRLVIDSKKELDLDASKWSMWRTDFEKPYLLWVSP